MGDKTMISLFNDYGKDIYALRASTDQKDDPRGQEPIFTVTGKDGKDKKITKDQYAAIETLAGIIPAVAENAGGTPALFKPSSTKETPAPTGLPATQQQPTATPEIPNAEGNPFAEKIKKIKTEETEKQKKLTTEEISKVVETTNNLQKALDGLGKGEYPNVMDYLPPSKKKKLESSSLDVLNDEYNVLASLKPAIEWLKKNPNHKDAPAAAEVIKQKLGI
jgi:hypothetical protein